MEIEIKAKVGDLGEIRKKLLDLGVVFTNSEQQDDSFFKPNGREMEDQAPGSSIVRIRRGKNSSFLNMKEMTPESGVWKEHETEITNPDETRRIIEKMGYSHIFDINKTREKGSIGCINVCLDNIKQLGKYIELEILGDNVDEAKQKILELLNKIAINESQIEQRGYARIISENMGVKFNNIK